MRVGVDATSWANRRGFGRFARNAVGRLVERDPETTYLFYVDEQSAGRVELPAGARARPVTLSRPPGEAAAAGSSRSVRDLWRLTRAVRADRPDVFLFPSPYTWFPTLGTPTVLGVHDTIADDLPELVTPARGEHLRIALKHRVAIRRATVLFTVSEASRRAIATRYRLAPERIAVVPEAPDPVFGPRTGDALASGLASVGLAADERFFLFVGGISPHKNVETLVDAYAVARDRLGPAAPLLVVAGDLEEETYLSSAASVRERITRHGLGAAVRLPGFVPDEALACLYAGSTAFVSPSLAEGFGLPAVEGAACGAPLALSDLPAHRESLDGAALFFAPTDVATLADVLVRLAGDEPLRRDLAARGRRAVEGLTWDASAAGLRALLADAARLP